MRKIKLNGKEYTLEYGHNAICAIEDVLGAENITEIIAVVFKGKSSFRMLRAIVWGGMLAEYRNITLEAVGEILDSDKNSFDAAQDAFAELVASVNGVLSVAEKKDEKTKN